VQGFDPCLQALEARRTPAIKERWTVVT
jgi:hypothetical protein